MSEEQATYAVAPVADAVFTPARPEEISVDILRNYLSTWSHGGQTITQFTARGVQHLAQLLNLSIVETDFSETSDGKGYYGTAIAENLSTGQRAHAAVFQSKTMKRRGADVEDSDALSKLLTRVQRNALSQLMPIDALKHRVMDAIQKGDVEKSELQQAQQAARKMLALRRKDLADMFGLSPTDAFEKAQERQGNATDWDATAWKAFRDATDTLDAEFFGRE